MLQDPPTRHKANRGGISVDFICKSTNLWYSESVPHLAQVEVMANHSKVPEIVGLLKQRIEAGDYNLNSLPGRRVLASELGVSPVTISHALKRLIGGGMLNKQSNGRLGIKRPHRGAKSLCIAFVGPSFDSDVQQWWRVSVEMAVAQRGGVVRAINYVGWHDPVIADALDGKFDGIFIIPPPEMPQVFLDRLAEAKGRVVTLWRSLTHLGIPCVTQGNTRFIFRLLEHMASLGHTRIDCFNAQPHTPRVDQWRQWLDARGLSGTLHDATTGGSVYSPERTYELARDVFASGRFNASAIFCTTAHDCMGIYRAAFDRGLRIGRDISACTCDSPYLCRLMIPTLTTLDPPSQIPLIARGLDWMLSRGQGWKASLEIDYDDIPLLVGESTQTFVPKPE